MRLKIVNNKATDRKNKTISFYLTNLLVSLIVKKQSKNLFKNRNTKIYQIIKVLNENFQLLQKTIFYKKNTHERVLDVSCIV